MSPPSLITSLFPPAILCSLLLSPCIFFHHPPVYSFYHLSIYLIYLIYLSNLSYLSLIYDLVSSVYRFKYVVIFPHLSSAFGLILWVVFRCKGVSSPSYLEQVHVVSKDYTWKVSTRRLRAINPLTGFLYMCMYYQCQKILWVLKIIHTKIVLMYQFQNMNI